MRTKEDFHKLIDTIQDEKVLKGYLRLIKQLNAHQTGALWNSLTANEKEELMLSYNESFDSKNLINHEDVKKQHSKWLGK